MKQLLGSAMIMMMIISTSYAQKKRVYLDERARITTKENAVSYEEWEEDKKKGLIGDFREYYISGKLKMVQHYQDDILYGEEIFYYENGQLASKGHYTNARKSGLWQEWYENGQLKEKTLYKPVVKDGVMQFIADGWVEEWHENGQQKAKGKYEDGKREGIWEKWYENGQLKEQGVYNGWDREGLWQEWYENGQLKSKKHYKEGDKVGVLETWHENGKRAMKGNYVEGDADGLWERWYPNEQLAEQTYYKEDELVKSATQWHLDGTKAAEYDFDKGILVNGWDKDGTQLVKDGNGRMKHYDFKGKLFVEGPYKDGVKDGEWKYEGEYAVSYEAEKLESTQGLSKGYDRDIFNIVEQSTEPIGGIESFYRYIRAKLIYPKAAKRKGHEGKVFLSFIIDKDGQVTHVKVIRGVSFSADREAVRILREAPAWNPGKQRGRAVKQRMTFPLNFVLR